MTDEPMEDNEVCNRSDEWLTPEMSVFKLFKVVN